MSNQAQRIIKKFGTQERLAAALHIRQSTVAAWKKRGVIPMRQAERIIEAARETGVDISPADFFEITAAE